MLFDESPQFLFWEIRIDVLGRVFLPILNSGKWLRVKGMLTGGSRVVRTRLFLRCVVDGGGGEGVALCAGGVGFLGPRLVCLRLVCVGGEDGP